MLEYIFPQNLSKGQPRIIREKIAKANKPGRAGIVTKGQTIPPVDAGWFQDSFRPRIMNPIELDKQLLTLGDHEIVRRHDKVRGTPFPSSFASLSVGEGI